MNVWAREHHTAKWTAFGGARSSRIPFPDTYQG